MAAENLERAINIAKEVLANVKPGQYGDPTPCASWDVRRLLTHYVGCTHWFALSMNAGASPEEDTTESTDYTQGDLLAAYDEGSKAALAAFRAPGAQEKIVKLPFGDLPGAVFEAIATNDVFTHAWDLAKATGQSTDLDPEFATQLTEGARMFVSPELRGPDGGQTPFGPEQQPSANATNADKHAAFLGRTV